MRVALDRVHLLPNVADADLAEVRLDDHLAAESVHLREDGRQRDYGGGDEERGHRDGDHCVEAGFAKTGE